MTKRAEHFLKGLTNDEKQISAVPPDRYGDRFVRFINAITMTREAAERIKAEKAALAVDAGVLAADGNDNTSTAMSQAEQQQQQQQQQAAAERPT